MAITDLRFAASLLKEGFSADEVRQIIGLKENVSPPADEAEQITQPEENKNSLQEDNAPEQPAPEPDTEPEPEEENQNPEPEKPEQPKTNPLTRNENQKSDSLVDTLAKLL